MKKSPMTRKGFEALEIELKQLKSTDRPAVIQAIAEARAHGDLSENAEYHAAREKQSFIEGRIAEVEAQISNAEIIDPLKLSGDKILFSATVTLCDEETEAEITYQIVGLDEADLSQGKLSYEAPLAKAMIGKLKGDSIVVQTPKGTKEYEILNVCYQ